MVWSELLVADEFRQIVAGVANDCSGRHIMVERLSCLLRNGNEVWDSCT